MAKDINVELGYDEEDEDEVEEGEEENEDDKETSIKESEKETAAPAPINQQTTSANCANEITPEALVTTDSDYSTINDVLYAMKLAEGDCNETSVSMPMSAPYFDRCDVDDDDAMESRSMYSTASTIPPDEVKKRLMKQMANKERRNQRKRCVAKGEASAVTRSRRDNNETVKHSDEVWG